MTDTSRNLAHAVTRLMTTLKDHPVSRTIAYADASMDVAAFDADPADPNAMHAMEKSVEDLLDELSINRLPYTPEHIAAKQAFEDVLQERVAEH